MQSTRTAQPWRSPSPLETVEINESFAAPVAEPAVVADERPRDGREELTRLQGEIERIVRGSRPDARETLDTALASVSRLQVATENIDACRPTPAAFAGSALVALADARLRGHADAIERGMTYTADNQMQLLRGER